jgi:peptidoglycan/xylan/chitin deacetylase (PgdA/CDA1 family)
VDVDGFGRWSLPEENGKARWAVLGEILEALKNEDPEARDALADRIAGQGTTRPGPALGPMSMEHLKELAETPGVTIGAHSHGHELLDQIPLQQARKSMARSRELLQDWTGQEVRHFAFPNGNHSQALRDIARELGFVSATVLEERTAPRGVDPFALPRISVGRYDSRNRVRLRLVGL